MTTGKTVALTIWTFISKVMSLLFNMLSRFVIGEGNGTPLQYPCLENPMDRGAWWAAVHGITKSQTQLSDFTFTFHFHALEKEMATHSSVLAWRIPGTGEPVGLPSMGLHRVGHDWSNLAARFVIAFLPRCKCLLLSWLQSPSAVILEPQKIKSVTISIVFPSICYEVMVLDAMIFVFWMLSFKPTFPLSSFTFIKRLLSSSSLSAIRVVSSVYLRLLIFLPEILIPACASSRHFEWCTLHRS